MSSGDVGAQVPEWLDEAFIRDALSAGGGQVEAVPWWEAASAVQEGANFMSSLLRLSCRLRPAGGGAEQRRSLVLKVGLPAGALASLAAEGRVFEREACVYRDVLPRVEAALRAAEGDAAFLPLAPRLEACGEPAGGRPAWLLLEDLRAAGFSAAPAGRGLDAAHCALALRVLARLHAASAPLASGVGTPLGADLFAQSPLTSAAACEQLSRLVPRHVRALSRALAAAGEAALAGRYEAAADKVVGCLRVLDAAPPPPPLTTLLHGDVWKNNFLFSYAGDRPTQVRLLDYQMVNRGSPAVDVVHFLYANASEAVHRSHLDELVGEYHGTLLSTLRALGLHQQAAAFSLEALRAEMRRYAPVALHCAVLMGLILGVESHGPEVKAALSSQQGAEAALDAVYANPGYLSCVRLLSPRFQEAGLL